MKNLGGVDRVRGMRLRNSLSPDILFPFSLVMSGERGGGGGAVASVKPGDLLEATHVSEIVRAGNNSGSSCQSC